MLREYFIHLVTLTVFACVVVEISHRGMKSIVGFGTGAIMLCAILLPLVDIFGSFDPGSVLDELMEDMDYEATDSAIEMAFEDGIAEYVAKEYGIDRGSVSVLSDGFDIGTLRAERIYITLRGKGVFLDFKRIEEEIEKEFTSGGECEVTVDLG